MSILVGRQSARAISDAPLKRSTPPTIRPTFAGATRMCIRFPAQTPVHATGRNKPIASHRSRPVKSAAISHGRRARALAAGVQPLTMPREFTVAIAT